MQSLLALHAWSTGLPGLGGIAAVTVMVELPVAAPAWRVSVTASWCSETAESAGAGTTAGLELLKVSPLGTHVSGETMTFTCRVVQDAPASAAHGGRKMVVGVTRTLSWLASASVQISPGSTELPPPLPPPVPPAPPDAPQPALVPKPSPAPSKTRTAEPRRRDVRMRAA